MAGSSYEETSGDFHNEGYMKRRLRSMTDKEVDQWIEDCENVRNWYAKGKK